MKETSGEVARVAPPLDQSPYHLRLYISGITPRSAMAVKNIKSICEQYLAERYELEVIDIYQQPKIAISAQIVAVPALLKLAPAPPVRLIGDLSDPHRVLAALNITP